MSFINWKPSPSKDLAYVLGVMYGDGYYEKKGQREVGLHCSDKEFAQAFRNSLEEIGLNPNLDLHEGYWRAYATSKKFAEWFEDLNLDEVRKIVSGYETNFVRGIYDSEGNLQVGRRKGRDFPSVRIRIVNTDRSLLEFIQSLLLDMGISSRIGLHSKEKVRWRKDEKRFSKEVDCFVLDLHSYTLTKLFLEKVDSSIERKSPKYLRKELSKYPESSRRVYSLEDYEKVLKLHKEEGLGANRISNKTGFPLPTVNGWIYRGNVPRHLKPILEVS